MDELITEYLESNGITFQLSAIDADGEIIVKYTDEHSAEDVAGFAGLLDEYIIRQAIESSIGKEESQAEAQMQEVMDWS